MVIKISIVGAFCGESTKLAELVSLLYENANKSVYCCWDYQHHLDKKFNVIINNIRNCNLLSLNDYNIILLPIRDVRDTIRSIKPKQRFKNNVIKKCLDNIYLFDKFKCIANHIFVYEKYSFSYIKELCEYLYIKPSDDEIQIIMEKIDQMEKPKKRPKLNKELSKAILNNQIIYKFLKKMDYLD
jgi:hypothetical protein